MKTAISRSKPDRASASRLVALDYLRGFFIVVIIIDHLWRWPSLLSIFTGEGKLWVSAAEGFIIISGLLVGYIRGYKNRDESLMVVSKKLLRRALLLYGWFVGMTLLYTVLIWYIPTASPQPWVEITTGHWQELITLTLQMMNAHIWVHFLYLYAIFLALTPVTIWLFRRGAAYIVALLALIGNFIGVQYDIEWLQWLPLFFLPAVAGYYLPTIQRWWSHQTPRTRTRQSLALYGITSAVLLLSAICTFIIPDNSVAFFLNTLFSKEFALDLWRSLLALICFVAFALAFNRTLPWLERWTKWLLLPLGHRSLTAYIVHGFVIFLISFFFVESANILYNTTLGIVAVAASLLLAQNRIIQKLIPR
ncbi:MAG: OpgC domain-containing protein [Candidatus Saccharimonadales bacterium]